MITHNATFVHSFVVVDGILRPHKQRNLVISCLISDINTQKIGTSAVLKPDSRLNPPGVLLRCPNWIPKMMIAEGAMSIARA